MSALRGAGKVVLQIALTRLAKHFASEAEVMARLDELATAEAARLLTGIVSDGVVRLSKGLWSASTTRMKRAFGRPVRVHGLEHEVDTGP